MSRLLNVLGRIQTEPMTIVIAGELEWPTTRALISTLHSLYLPGTNLILADRRTIAGLGDRIDSLRV